MPTGTREQIGNEVFEQIIYLPTVQPPTVTTATITYQAVALPGIQVGDLVSWNLISPTNVLLTISNCYCAAVNVLQVGWATAGATLTGLATQQVMFSVARPENATMGLSFLPSNLT